MVSSAESDTSEMDTVREREGPVRCEMALLLLMLGPSSVLSPTALNDCPSSTPWILILFLRPRCRSRSIPRHISSVTP